MDKRPTRIMIFGHPGSGKSTFEFTLHQATGILLYHLDKYFYTINWIKHDYAEFLTIQQSFVDEKHLDY
ncbi:MAG: hypothetical protein ACYC2U_01025 [Candidatus Amoebophilus sp.]